MAGGDCLTMQNQFASSQFLKLSYCYCETQLALQGQKSTVVFGKYLLTFLAINAVCYGLDLPARAMWFA
jgi:hypothetical protein